MKKLEHLPTQTQKIIKAIILAGCLSMVSIGILPFSVSDQAQLRSLVLISAVLFLEAMGSVLAIISAALISENRRRRQRGSSDFLSLSRGSWEDSSYFFSQTVNVGFLMIGAFSIGFGCFLVSRNLSSLFKVF